MLRGPQGTSRVASGNSNSFCVVMEAQDCSSHCSGIRPHLTLRGESHFFFFFFIRVAAGSFGFLSSCNGNLRESLRFNRGSQVGLRVARGTSVFCSCCRGIGPHLELMRETQGSFQVATGISEFLLTFNRGVRPCLVLNHRTPLSSRVIKWVSSLLLS